MAFSRLVTGYGNFFRSLGNEIGSFQRKGELLLAYVTATTGGVHSMEGKQLVGSTCMRSHLWYKVTRIKGMMSQSLLFSCNNCQNIHKLYLKSTNKILQIKISFFSLWFSFYFNCLEMGVVKISFCVQFGAYQVVCKEALLITMYISTSLKQTNSTVYVCQSPHPPTP